MMQPLCFLISSAAARQLRRQPVFTVVAVLSIKLGIGANAAIFSVIHGVLLEPLPYDEPEALLQVREVTSTSGSEAVLALAYQT